MKQILLFMTFFVLSFADTEFAEPKPSIDNPRKIVFPITKGDDESINHVLSSANNVMKFYGPENVNIAIICYSKGIRTLLKKEKKIAVRVRSLQTYDVEFIACGNTMRTLKIKPEDLIEDVEIVTAGIVELVERDLKGWIYIRP
ncbi:DsrE family protein [Hydrogenimonas thermophila]|uniref:DsrE family protein n=1 Tax=Hydrogenimonas thermophila TaxID=223786 RepID=UPI002937063E|nr:DsrE family protein [Hydrogenimonas thermophila]WOE71102.1 DsrE family protein [Hydrogenimonas thermophila]WOE73620.1 DsrE family protein [Hydrogenimonas thermophila]